MKLLHQFQHITNPYDSNVGNKQESLHQEDDITSAVKPVSRDMATIEAEKDEIIVKPDLSGIYKIKGKRHYAGGTPLKAEAGSFIFSDYQKLALKKDDQKLMEFKLGGITKSKNTPAKVLERNIDIEHYNRAINILDDPYRDVIAKRSAQLMLDKYQNTLGRIAYLQEEKKQFKEGTPNFVAGTAPVRDDEMQNEIDEQAQYKTGGMTNFYQPNEMGNPYNTDLFGKERLRYEEGGSANPYLPIAQQGGKKYPVQQTVASNGEKTIFFSNGTYQIIHNDGTIMQRKLGQESGNFPVGENDVVSLSNNPNGSISYQTKKGEVIVEYPNGRVMRQDTAGNIKMGTGTFNNIKYDSIAAPKPVTVNTLTDEVSNIPVTPVTKPTTPILGSINSNPNTQNGYPSWLKMWDKANQNPGGYTTPTGEDSRYNKAAGNEIYDNYNRWKGLNGNKEFSGPEDYQKFVYNYINEKNPSAITDMWKKMGLNNLSKTDKDVQAGKIFGQFADGMFGARTAALTNWKPSAPVIAIPPAIAPVVAAPVVMSDRKLEIPKNNNRYLPYEPNVSKTLPMIQDEVIAGLNAVGVKRYDPYRQQVKSPLIEMNYLNSQGALNTVNQSVNEAYNATRGLNPYQAQSSMNEVFSKSLANKADINFKYDQANNEIGNKQNELNQRAQQSDMQGNSNADKLYTDQTVLANSRFDNAQGVARNAWQGLRNSNQEKLDALYNVLAQQPIAGSNPVLDRNGNQVYDNQGKAVMQSMPLYDVVPGTIRTKNTGAGNILNANMGHGETDYYDLLNKQIATSMDMSLSENARKIAAANAQTLQKIIAGPGKRKLGGLINPYRK